MVEAKKSECLTALKKVKELYKEFSFSVPMLEAALAKGRIEK
tara:strand:+ start:4070 stop:4195 length:126 start_codon:yes stop_codon:yes gene_type:complete